MGGQQSASPSPHRAELEKIIHDHPAVMFSTTYCPYCTKAKSLFERMKVNPHVVELNNHPNGNDLWGALVEITRQETVPNIFIGGVHIGGYTELLRGVKNGTVQKHFMRVQIQYEDIINEF